MHGLSNLSSAGLIVENVSKCICIIWFSVATSYITFIISIQLLPTLLKPLSPKQLRREKVWTSLALLLELRSQPSLGSIQLLGDRDNYYLRERDTIFLRPQWLTKCRALSQSFKQRALTVELSLAGQVREFHLLMMYSCYRPKQKQAWVY